MTEKELDNWFCSLPVSRKNHIATKVTRMEYSSSHNGEKAPVELLQSKLYPHCTQVWMSLPSHAKDFIHSHCTNDHGDWIQEGGDAPIFSY